MALIQRTKTPDLGMLLQKELGGRLTSNLSVERGHAQDQVELKNVNFRRGEIKTAIYDYYLPKGYQEKKIHERKIRGTITFQLGSKQLVVNYSYLKINGKLRITGSYSD